jgi:Fic family protein
MGTSFSSKELIEKSTFIGRYYQIHAGKSLNSRQEKVIKKLLEYYPRGFEGGLTNRKYVSITKTTAESAKRDLKDLVTKGFIIQNEGGGRSVSYRINERLSEDRT